MIIEALVTALIGAIITFATGMMLAIKRLDERSQAQRETIKCLDTRSQVQRVSIEHLIKKLQIMQSDSRRCNIDQIFHNQNVTEEIGNIENFLEAFRSAVADDAKTIRDELTKITDSAVKLQLYADCQFAQCCE